MTFNNKELYNVFIKFLRKISSGVVILSLPDITTTLRRREKEHILWHLILRGEMYCLKSYYLLLWLLGTLASQYKFYGTRLVTLKGRYYHP